MEQEIEVKQLSEREMWVGKNRMYLGKDNIIYITAIGNITEEIAKGFQEIGLKLANLIEGKADILLDLNECGKPSPEARKIVQELSRHEKTKKVAAFGVHPVARIIVTFGMGADFTKGYFRFFKTKEESLSWLKK